MKFYTKLDNSFEKKNICFLQRYSWNDWWIWETKYGLYYYDSNEKIHDIGTIKIGAVDDKLVKNVSNDHKHPDLPESFSHLTSDFFSIGLSEIFYINLQQFGDIFRQDVLFSLNDIAFSPKIYEEKRQLPITQSSLMREMSHLSVVGRLRNLANGNAKLTEFDFSYRIFSDKFNEDSTVLDFMVDPDSFPPSNIHVITGRNGVGKTHLFKNMLSILKNGETRQGDFGEFFTGEENKINEIFSNVISVSFSAFDEIQIDDENDINYSQLSENGISHKYIGLKGMTTIKDFFEENKIKIGVDEEKLKEKIIIHKTEEKLAEDFIKSLRRCKSFGRYNRWKLILSILESDPLFAENNLTKMLDSKDINGEGFYIEAKKIFKRMSSGHSIVLLTITKLIEFIEEKSLILLDEPEGHLHPPLLSAFTRAISILLRQKMLLL